MKNERRLAESERPRPPRRSDAHRPRDRCMRAKDMPRRSLRFDPHTARHAAGQVLGDGGSLFFTRLPVHVGRNERVQIVADVHGVILVPQRDSLWAAARRSWSSRRPREIRDMTVPIGMQRCLAISA